jgi:hypothetical protein
LEKNIKKAGRPKIDNRKDIKITIRVTDEENIKLENISKKLGIKKTELIRLFTLGTENKTPKDILFHNRSFYPFANELLNLLDFIKEKDINISDFTEYNRTHSITYDDYINSSKNVKILEKCKNKYKKLDIRFIEIRTLKEFNKENPILFSKKTDNVRIIEENFKVFMGELTYDNIKNSGLEKYLSSNERLLKNFYDLKEYENEKLIIIYGNNSFDLLSIIPYNENF